MPKKKYPPEKIIGMLREAELAVNQGKTVVEACRKMHCRGRGLLLRDIICSQS